MLRVGLTGSLGSGKSTVAAILRDLGAEVIEADELGRELMEPGHQVYDEIVAEFGPEVVLADGKLNRPKLAELVFNAQDSRSRLDDLNSIVHPAVIAAQGDWMRQILQRNHRAIAVVESALIFEVERDARQRGESEGILTYWRRRFDCVVLVTAPEALKVGRYVERRSPGEWDEAIATDARARLARQISDEQKIKRADFVLENTGTLEELRAKVLKLWKQLRTRNGQSSN
jgi:dephospho-CoA kinase